MKELTIIHLDTQTSWRGGERQALELIKGLNSRNQTNILFCKPSSEISKRAKEAGIRVMHLSLAGEWDIVSAYRLRSFIVRERVNVVHVHTSHAHTIALFALLGLTSCKLVVSRRVDFHVKDYFSRRFKYGRSVDKIITVSDAIRRILIEDGIDPKSVVTIRSGFVLGEFIKSNTTKNLRSQLNLSDDNVVIVTVAALAPHKALHVLLKAAHIVVKKHPEARFLIAGEGEMKSVIEKNIYNLGLEKFVILLGFIKDIASVYRTADIFALSSREEGLCTSILDGMYFGLPFVTTNAGGIPELVQDQVNGLLVPVNDHMLFAEQLIYLIENPDRRKKMGLRSSGFLENNSIEKTIEDTLSVYRDLCK